MSKDKEHYKNPSELSVQSELLYIENIVFVIIFLSIFPIFWDVQSRNIVLALIIIFISIYISTMFLIRKIYFFSDYLIIFYPTRIFFKRRKIEYPLIEKIKYVYSNSAYAVPEIQIIKKNSLIPYLYVSLSYKKRKEILQYLFKIGLNIEINSEYERDKKILKDVSS